MHWKRRPRRRRHELHPPKGLLLQESLLHQLPQIPTFLCSLRVKGMANRVVNGTRSLFPKRNFSSMRRQIIDYYGTRSSNGTSSLFPKRTFSSMRRQIIDHYGTRSSDGTRSLSPKRNFFVHETTNYRLLLYSTFGRDKIPISQRGIISSSTRQQLIDYSGTRSPDGTSSLSPRT